MARSTTTTGEPSVDQDERDDDAAGDRAHRVDRDERAGFTAGMARVVRQQGRGRRKTETEHDRHRQHDEESGPEQRLEVVEGGARVQGLRSDDDRDKARKDERGDDDLGAREEANGIADPRSDEVEQERTQREADEEDPEDDREHVRRVARP
jgi:hypothetical protein